jgi:phage tail sheath protein FI
MPVQVSYPGVYIEEIPSGVHAITGVATSIAAFVDAFPSGPIGEAVRILSFADFERQFGGLSAGSEASYAIQQFFLNGGAEAYVVRVTSTTAANAATKAAIALQDKVGGSSVLTVTAIDEGAWGDSVRLDVDYDTTDPTKRFNLTVTEVATTNGVTSVVATEKFLNLVLDGAQANDAAATVNAASQLVRLSNEPSTAGSLPAQTGTVSAALGTIASLNLTTAMTMDVQLGANKVGSTATLSSVPTTHGGLAAALQTLLRHVLDASNKPVLPNATVTVVGSPATKVWLVARSGTSSPADYLAFTDAGSGLAHALGFSNNTAAQNVQQYALGGMAAQAQALPGGSQQAGSDGAWNPATDATGMTGGLIGDPVAKTGLYALMDVDLFNILCIPATMNLPDTSAAQVATAATSLCTKRRAMYLLDVPQPDNATRDTVDAISTWLSSNAGLRSRNAALYFPRLDIADPLADYRLRKVSPSGTVAGLWARIDGSRGVWKAPAGTEASLAGVQKLEYKLTDPENGVLNPLAINCLRVFPIYGPVCWGARTLYGADQLADDYKYIPIRRLALYIEESLFRGTQWVVFEPNDSPLWAQVRLSVGTFMQTLFRQGAFQGSTPSDAYFVQCDSKNNPQASIDLGILNITVGFAPLKPAEFVVIQIQQISGQTAS